VSGSERADERRRVEIFYNCESGSRSQQAYLVVSMGCANLGTILALFPFEVIRGKHSPRLS
jgi:hypothetical protein